MISFIVTFLVTSVSLSLFVLLFLPVISLADEKYGYCSTNDGNYIQGTGDCMKGTLLNEQMIEQLAMEGKDYRELSTTSNYIM